MKLYNVVTSKFRRNTIVGISLIHQYGSVIRVEELGSAHRHLHTGFVACSNLWLAFATATGLYHKHTISALNTINCRSRSILKNRYLLYFIHIDLRQLFVSVLHIIDYDKRLVAIAVERTHTTYEEIAGVLTRLTATLLAEETRQLALKRVLNTTCGHALYLGSIKAAHRTRKGELLGLLITHYHKVVEVILVYAHHHIEVLLAAYSYRLALEAYVGYLEHIAYFCLYCKRTVKVGSCAHRGAFYSHCYARQKFAFGRRYHTFQGEGLRHCYRKQIYAE